MEYVTYTRNQLYDEVWREPLTKLAARLCISDVGLAKACKRMQIPLPGLGYWAKVAAGQKLTKIPLPPPIPGLSQISFQLEVRPPVVPRPRPIKPPPEFVREIGDINVSNMDNPQTITREYMRALEHSPRYARGIREAEPVAGIEMKVSPESADRALAILDTIVLKLKAWRAAVREKQVDDGGRYSTRKIRALELDDERIHISITESAKQRRRSDEEMEREASLPGHPYVTRMHYIPTGILTLTLPDAPANVAGFWKIDPTTDLTQIIIQFLATVRLVPEHIKTRRRLAQEAAARQHEIERRKQEAKWLEERRLKQLQTLSDEAEMRLRHMHLLQYLDHLEQSAKVAGKTLTPAFFEGIAEARSMADRMDPTTPRIESLSRSGFLPPEQFRGW